MFFRCIAAFCLTASLSFAQTTARTLAKDGFAAKLAALEGQSDASQYEIGFLSALRAIEKAAQAQQQERVGLSLQSNPIFGFGRRGGEALPPARPEALRDITTTLLSDLQDTRNALGAITDPENATFELNVNDIWFDLDQDGFRGETENVIAAMTPILGRRAVQQAAELQTESGADIIIRFDHADIAWLTAYTHMLSAIGEVTLAFDPTPIIADLQTSRVALDGGSRIDTDWMLGDLSVLQFVDGAYVLLESLRQNPDPARLNAALKHWEAMIKENQVFWTLVAQETDNQREWVPNPQQISAIGIEITRDTADTWQQILREADAVVAGELLIPHPFLPRGTGISLKKYFDDPAPLDLMGWLQGRSAYPYVQSGQRISEQTWQRLQRLSGGNATLFAFFLN